MRTVVLVAPYAMPNTLTYVEALLALRGVRPVVISSDPLERFPQHIRRALEYHEQVADCFSAEQVGAALKRIGPRCLGVDRVFGVLEQLQLAVAGARDIARIPGMSLAETTRFRDKSVMKQMLRDAGIPCARHARVEAPEDALRFAEAVGYPLIVKPVDGLGTRSTWRVGSREELDKALATMRPSPTNTWQIEEFLVGTEHSFETVTIDGRHIWSSSTNYKPGPLDAMENPWIQYCVVLPRETENLDRFQAVNHAALNALGMRTGLSHMEWFTRRDGSVAVNEVGARPPGVNIMPLMSLTHGVDFVKAWVRLMALDQFEPPTRTRAAGSAFLRGQGRGGRVKAVHGLARVREEVGRWIVDAKIPQPGTPKADGYEGEGHIVVAADTTAEVEHALSRIIRTVKVELG